MRANIVSNNQKTTNVNKAHCRNSRQILRRCTVIGLSGWRNFLLTEPVFMLALLCLPPLQAALPEAWCVPLQPHRSATRGCRGCGLSDGSLGRGLPVIQRSEAGRSALQIHPPDRKLPATPPAALPVVQRSDLLTLLFIDQK